MKWLVECFLPISLNMYYKLQQSCNLQSVNNKMCLQVIIHPWQLHNQIEKEFTGYKCVHAPECTMSHQHF